MMNFDYFKINTAEIVAVGTELLMGQITNTNATYLAAELRNLGINCKHQSVVGDNPERMLKELSLATSRAECVLVTGGLGPTADDITMQVVSDLSGLELEYHPEIMEKIESYFSSMGRKTAPSNKKQAYIPQNSLIIDNNNGTAPGAIVPIYEGTLLKSVVVVLPGPPIENKLMFQESVVPFLINASEYQLETAFIKTIGIGESDACARLDDVLAKYSDNPTVAPYAQTGEVYFRVSYRHKKCDIDIEPFNKLVEEVRFALKEYIYEIGDRSIVDVCSDLLKQYHVSISSVESCTAGGFAASLGAISGISQVFRGSMVTYQTVIKERVLNIDHNLLINHGTISTMCAEAMAERGKEVFGSDLCVAITGNAGPEASEGKPVGLVYITCMGQFGLETREFLFVGNREKIQHLAVKNAFQMVWHYLLKHYAR